MRVRRLCYVDRDHGLETVAAKSPPHRPTRLPTERHETFKRHVLAGPTEADGVYTLRGRHCIAILEAEFEVQYSLSDIYELLHRLKLAVLRVSSPAPSQRP